MIFFLNRVQKLKNCNCIFFKCFLIILSIYFSCGAKNPYGVDLSCSWINIVTEFPDNTANAKIIIGSVISTGIIMIFAFILILYYALNQKKKRKEMKNAAREVVLWAKRVTVTTDEQRYDNSNGSTEVQVLP